MNFFFHRCKWERICFPYRYRHSFNTILGRFCW